MVQIIFQLHMILHYVSISTGDQLASPKGRLTGVKLGQEINREYGAHSLHCVIPRSSDDIFTHILEKYLGLFINMATP